jgi:cytoskeletal protein CcmA (bactofilin family)
MAIFGKDRERRGEGTRLGAFESPISPGGPVAEGEMYEREKARAVTPDVGGSNAFIGKGSRIVGKLSFEGPARIEGTVEGEITAQDTLTIGESAVVNALITGSAVIIHGRVTGDVVARKRLEIRAPGRLLGNITTPSLVIHEGVVFEGQCSMGSEVRATDKDRKVAIVFPHGERDGDAKDASRAAVELAK